MTYMFRHASTILRQVLANLQVVCTRVPICAGVCERERENVLEGACGCVFLLEMSEVLLQTFGKSKHVAMIIYLHDLRGYRSSSRLPIPPYRRPYTLKGNGGRIQHLYIASFDPCSCVFVYVICREVGRQAGRSVGMDLSNSCRVCTVM